jgi:homoaconitase/3-isopropylmalate dehydratase large subunit
LNEEIESIDKIASILQDREGVLDKIKLMISPSTRKEKREILIQQLTESLGNNDLFLAGYRFKTQ